MELEPRTTLIVAILVLFLGRFINGRVGFFRDYNIPEPVTGGLLASLIVGMIYWLTNLEINFYMRNRDMLLVVFFTTISVRPAWCRVLAWRSNLLLLIATSSEGAERQRRSSMTTIDRTVLQ